MKPIYDNVKIMYNEKQEVFEAVDVSTNVRVGKSKDLDTLIQIKKAYCDGYYDGYYAKEKENELNKESK